MWSRSLFSIGALVALHSGVAQAGVVTGQMLDSDGQPVANAIFQFTPVSGGDLPFVSGGFTTADGSFTTTVTPDGSYNLIVFPPAPPQSLLVTKRIENITSSPVPQDLGVTVLEKGVLATGRVVNSIGTPLVSVGLEFVAPPDNQPLDFTYGDTDASGHFRVAVPYGPCELRFKPGQVPYYGGPDTAATSHSWIFTGPTDLGTIAMPVG